MRPFRIHRGKKLRRARITMLGMRSLRSGEVRRARAIVSRSIRATASPRVRALPQPATMEDTLRMESRRELQHRNTSRSRLLASSRLLLASRSLKRSAALPLPMRTLRARRPSTLHSRLNIASPERRARLIRRILASNSVRASFV